jgi:hypothetical protein
VFAGLLGLISGAVAKAQVMRPAILTDGDLVVRQVKPKNNECPVCGTLADKYQARQGLGDCRGSGNGVGDVACAAVYIYGERVVRCTFCNCAFFQDGEKP